MNGQESNLIKYTQTALIVLVSLAVLTVILLILCLSSNNSILGTWKINELDKMKQETIEIKRNTDELCIGNLDKESCKEGVYFKMDSRSDGTTLIFNKINNKTYSVPMIDDPGSFVILELDGDTLYFKASNKAGKNQETIASFTRV